jgi:hypothetical protein
MRAAATPARNVVRAACVLGASALVAVPSLLGWLPCAFVVLLHRPCPGCGMTRAVLLLQEGDFAGSVRMHPLALPVLLAVGLALLSMVRTTLATGSPLEFYKRPMGRAALALFAVVYAAALGLWVMRWLGLFGGPVPVDP